MQLSRSDVIDSFGKDTIRQIYENAQVFHCEPIAKISDYFITKFNLKLGSFENLADKCGNYPDYWSIGAVYARLITDASKEIDIVDTLFQVYHSWISKFIDNYNLPIFYQSRDYLAACYEEGKILD